MVKRKESERECSVTGKLRFATEDDAHHAADKARKERKLRAFFCKACRGFHLTRVKGEKYAVEQRHG